MNNIKYAVEGLIRRPFIFLVILFQVVLGTMLLQSTLSITLNMIDTVTISKNMFKDKSIYSLTNSSGVEVLDKVLKQEDSTKELYDLYSFLKNNTSFSVCAAANTNALVKGLVDDDRFYQNKDGKHANLSGEDYSVVKTYYVDDNYLKQFPLRIEQGRNFSSNDFEVSEEVPVILGSSYRKYYSIGQTFKSYDYMSKKYVKLKVIGILKPNSNFVNSASIISLDENIIQPFRNFDIKTATVNNYLPWLNNCFVITNNKTETLNSIRSKSEALGLFNFNLVSCQEQVDEVIAALSDSMGSSIMISILVFLFISIGIITVQINSIKDRLGEFGVHLMTGAQKKDISRRFLYSSGIYIVLGMSIGEYFAYTIGKNPVFNYDTRVILCLIPIAILLIVLISILPLIKIKNIEVSAMIRRRE